MISDLEIILRKSWSKETCYPASQSNWSSKNPSDGQCAITALVVNDFNGGKIMRCMCNGISHYYNLINNQIVDYTAEQFGNIIPDYQNGEERTREYLLSNDDTKNRYIMLLNNVKDNFINYGLKEYVLINSEGNTYQSQIPGTLGGNKKLKIYGKFDCTSALSYIKKGQYVQNRVFFKDEESAILAGYRPCEICMKSKYKEWAEKILSRKR